MCEIGVNYTIEVLIKAGEILNSAGDTVGWLKRIFSDS